MCEGILIRIPSFLFFVLAFSNMFYLDNRTDYIITHKGEKAAKIGVKEYNRKIEDSILINERRTKNSYILLIISVVVAMISLIVSLLTVI